MATTTFDQNMKFSQDYQTRACELIGRSTVRSASIQIDRNEGTDFKIINANGKAVAYRTRRWEKAGHLSPFEFTIRTRSCGGGKTEYHKFCDGYADQMFYGVINKDKTDFATWILFRLDPWRRLEEDYKAGRSKWSGRTGRGGQNIDGSAWQNYSANHDRYAADPLFMIDCWDHSAFTKGKVQAAAYIRSRHPF